MMDFSRIPGIRIAALSVALTLAALPLGPPRTVQAGDDVPEPPDLSGTYSAEGLLPDSTAYTGTIELKKKLSAHWRTGPKYVSYELKVKYSTGWEANGLATYMDNRLYFCADKNSKYLGLVVYHPVKLSGEISDLRTRYRSEFLDPKNKKKMVEVKGNPWYTDIWWHDIYGVMLREDGAWAVATVGLNQQGQTWSPLGAGDWGFSYCYYKSNGEANILDGQGGRMIVEPVGDVWKVMKWVQNEKNQKVLADQSRRPPEADAWVSVGFMPDPNTLVTDFNNDLSTDMVGCFEIVGNKFVGRVCDGGNMQSPYPMTLTCPDKVADIIAHTLK